MCDSVTRPESPWPSGCALTHSASPLLGSIPLPAMLQGSPSSWAQPLAQDKPKGSTPPSETPGWHHRGHSSGAVPPPDPGNKLPKTQQLSRIMFNASLSLLPAQCHPTEGEDDTFWHSCLQSSSQGSVWSLSSSWSHSSSALQGRVAHPGGSGHGSGWHPRSQ